MTELTPDTNEPQVVIDSAVDETPSEVVQNSESAPETQAEDNGEVESGKRDTKAEERIRQLTAEKYALKRQLDEKQPEQSKSVEAPTSELAPPSLPNDVYDDEAMRKYHSDMVEYSNQSARQAAASEYQKRESEQVATQQRTQLNKTLEDYTRRGLEKGLTIDQMQLSEQVLNGAGISPDLGVYIMGDPQGAEIANYLSTNPTELQSVLSLTPAQASVKIATEIKQKLATAPAALPDPVETISGTGSVPTTDAFYAGGGKLY